MGTPARALSVHLQADLATSLVDWRLVLALDCAISQHGMAP